MSFISSFGFNSSGNRQTVLHSVKSPRAELSSLGGSPKSTAVGARFTPVILSSFQHTDTFFPPWSLFRNRLAVKSMRIYFQLIPSVATLFWCELSKIVRGANDYPPEYHNNKLHCRLGGFLLQRASRSNPLSRSSFPVPCCRASSRQQLNEQKGCAGYDLCVPRVQHLHSRVARLIATGWTRERHSDERAVAHSRSDA